MDIGFKWKPSKTTKGLAGEFPCTGPIPVSLLSGKTKLDMPLVEFTHENRALLIADFDGDHLNRPWNYLNWDVFYGAVQQALPGWSVVRSPSGKVKAFKSVLKSDGSAWTKQDAEEYLDTNLPEELKDKWDRSGNAYKWAFVDQGIISSLCAYLFSTTPDSFTSKISKPLVSTPAAPVKKAFTALFTEEVSDMLTDLCPELQQEQATWVAYLADSFSRLQTGNLEIMQVAVANSLGIEPTKFRRQLKLLQTEGVLVVTDPSYKVGQYGKRYGFSDEAKAYFETAITRGTAVDMPTEFNDGSSNEQKLLVVRLGVARGWSDTEITDHCLSCEAHRAPAKQMGLAHFQTLVQLYRARTAS